MSLVKILTAVVSAEYIKQEDGQEYYALKFANPEVPPLFLPNNVVTKSETRMVTMEITVGGMRYHDHDFIEGDDNLAERIREVVKKAARKAGTHEDVVSVRSVTRL